MRTDGSWLWLAVAAMALWGPLGCDSDDEGDADAGSVQLDGSAGGGGAGGSADAGTPQDQGTGGTAGAGGGIGGTGGEGGLGGTGGTAGAGGTGGTAGAGGTGGTAGAGGSGGTAGAGGEPGECATPRDCIDGPFWNIRCLGHWSCDAGTCVEICDDVGCGDGQCDPDAGEDDHNCGPDCDAPDCLQAGEGDGVFPGARQCCPGLQALGCDAPNADNICPMGCDGAFVCGNCGDDQCGAGENHCNCPADCSPPATACEAADGYCDHFMTPCRDGYQSSGPMGCPLGRSGQCCLPADNCVEAGGSVPVVPNAPQCCPGLNLIPCDGPGENGQCRFGCVGAAICAACGDGQCGAGENLCNCPDDCADNHRDDACDDGTDPICDLIPPICAAHEIFAHQNNCYRCVNPATCAPWGQPGCRADADCATADYCNECASGSCPACADCVPGCSPHGCATEPEPACDMARPQCAADQVAVVDNGCWQCVGRLQCLPAARTSYFLTCGDPVCGGHTPQEGIPRCDGQMPGQACAEPGALCDPGDVCNAMVICADADPREGPCPISKAEFKQEIRYLTPQDGAQIAKTVRNMKLATWRYRHAPTDRPSVGFIIDDAPHPAAVQPDGRHVDLYGYTSLAVAAVQHQGRELDALKAELKALRTQVEACAKPQPMR